MDTRNEYRIFLQKPPEQPLSMWDIFPCVRCKRQMWNIKKRDCEVNWIKFCIVFAALDFLNLILQVSLSLLQFFIH